MATIVLTTSVAAAAVFGPAPAAGNAEAARPAADGPVGASWQWPVAPPHALLAPFEAPPTPYAAGHRGIDIAAAPGSVVLATADGTVSFAGVVVDRPVLSVQHGDGLVSSVEPVVAGVSAGDAVRAGQAVGVVASGAHCDGRCIHLGVRLHGEYVNPLALLGTLDRAVLLPLGR